jgi:cell division protein FtsI (penicillin-binding protein 3)
VAPHGVLSAREIMEESSNIGMAKLVARLAPTELAEFIERFGFGQATGIELPGEARGEVAPPAAWSGYTRASLAFGQELSATALQVAGAFSIIANNGIRIPPRVLLGTVDSAGAFQAAPPPATSRTISVRTAREVGSMLEGVIVRGTGHAAAVVGYRLAGKSGTAQKAITGGYSQRDFVASFGGYGPVPSPRLVALVILDAPKYGRHRGGSAAAPTFGRIMAEALAYLRVPADEHPLAVTRSSRAGSGVFEAAGVTPARTTPVPAVVAGQVPELQGLSLREALVRLAAAGLQARVAGSGVVVGQEPPAGAMPGRGAWCRLELGPRAE